MIYFDHNATTPCHPDVVKAMLPYFTEKFGHASSGAYPLSWQSELAVDESRKSVASLLDVSGEEIIFTSGATEACYLGIRGLIELYHIARKDFVPHIISSPLEHSAVLEVIRDMERMGWCTVSWTRADEHGIIDLEDVKRLKEDNTVLLAVMLANNVTGVVQDIKTMAEWARSEKIVTFCDTTQAVGKVPLSLKELGVDMAAVSAHKMYGPKGVGCLYLRKGRPSIRIKALMAGGGQEKKMRGGTMNVPAIVGMGKAAELSCSVISGYTAVQELRDWFEDEMTKAGDVYVWGQGADRLPHVSMVGIKGLRGVDILNKMKGKYAFSLGSACQAHENKPSYVIEEMKADSPYIEGSFRLSLGIENTREELLSFIKDIKTII